MGRRRTPLIDLATHPHKYVRPRDLAVYCVVSLRTIYHHIDKGALHAVRIGGVLRIPIESARAYAGVSSRLSA